MNLQVLFEQPDLPAYPLPSHLRERYGGGLGFSSPRLFANFVSSLDGVVAIGASPPSLISDKSEADRFVMGLLRACADAVVIGAGTLRAEPDHLWTPEHISPPEATAYQELRRTLGRPEPPRLVVLTTRGNLPVGAVALELGALVLTTAAGADRLRGRLPTASTVVALSDGEHLEPAPVLRMLEDQGHLVVLSEGGPTLIGHLVQAQLLDELFLTLSPVLAGRSSREGHDRRLALVEGAAFPPDTLPRASLLSVRKDSSHLFLRYQLAANAQRARAVNPPTRAA